MARRCGHRLRVRCCVGCCRSDGTLRNLGVTDDPTAPDLGDGVTATRLVGAAHIIPGLWNVDVYDPLEHYLLDTFELTPGPNYFPFPYDWRRDNRASARHLERCAHTWLSDCAGPRA